MKKNLETMRNNAAVVENQIIRTRIMAKKDPNSPVDYEAILKSQYALLDAIHDNICDIIIEEDNKITFWKKLFRK